MLAAVIWGLIQGVTEFLPVSSDGHLVVIPAFLNKFGFDVQPPELATTAVLHLGTLVAMFVYFRHDLARVIRFRTDPEGRRIAFLVAIGTIPVAIIGLPLATELNTFQTTISNVGWALIGNGVILFLGYNLASGTRRIMDMRVPDAVLIGLAQALALIPGISRSGTTIAVGSGRKIEPLEAARYSFLLGIPAITGAGLLELYRVSDAGGFEPVLLLGVLVAGITGYLAIAWLMASLKRFGLLPFAIYCVVLGALTVIYF
ncbi:MAG: undecaprenyl-diphosphate phosphatase [Actinomycetota bacterium]|nr:undecaprenyl-diphosphate phosphatase [Actinomycetota bacterium]